MNYEEACEYINDIPRFTTKNSLEHTRELLDLLGNPQEQLQVIHVAGTNGKGSVCAYISRILESEGYAVGLFTSPHLISMNERIMIDGIPVSKEDFAAVFDEVMLAIRVLENRNAPHPSFFEFLFVMGMLCFARAKVSYVVLETGLGGRLDATNALKHPLLTVITSISMDHMQYLGNTLQDIAKEKAGIIKSGVKVIFDGNNKVCAKVISDTAEKRQTSAHSVTKDAFDIVERSQDSIAFSIKDVYDKCNLWRLSTGALYQAENAALAIKACEQVVEQPRYEQWEKALETVCWPGRMERIQDGIYMDGAHNIGAIQRFAESAAKADVILFSAVSDKNYEEMIQWLCEHVEVKTYVITAISDVRGEEAEKLAETFAKYTHADIVVEKNPKKAWETARNKKSKNGAMYCLGSLYLIGTIKELLQEAN